MNALPRGTRLPTPYCSACGHDLTGAVDSARCPECGGPLVEVLVRGKLRFGAMVGKPVRRYESPTRVLGLPLLSIALGIDEEGRIGRAKGYVAVGDIATGVFAFGGLARGVVAFGGVSLGIVTFGGLSIGTLAAFGGGAVALLGSAMGGFAAGLVAAGGAAIGVIAQGGLAIGWLARGAKAIGEHAWPQGARVDEQTAALFESFRWLIGAPGGMPQIHFNLAWTVAIAVLVALLALIPLLRARRRRDPIAAELGRASDSRGR